MPEWRNAGTELKSKETAGTAKPVPLIVGFGSDYKYFVMSFADTGLSQAADLLCGSTRLLPRM